MFGGSSAHYISGFAQAGGVAIRPLALIAIISILNAGGELFKVYFGCSVELTGANPFLGFFDRNFGRHVPKVERIRIGAIDGPPQQGRAVLLRFLGRKIVVVPHRNFIARSRQFLKAVS